MLKILRLIIVFSFLLILLVPSKSFAAEIAKVQFVPAGKISAGKVVKVNVIIDSNVPVNAAQINIVYPESEFSLTSVDTTTSKFTIKAEETLSNGLVKIARGNITPLKGKNLLAILNLVPKTNSSSISKLSYSVTDSLVMSTDNVNILSHSQVMTIKPIKPTPPMENSNDITSLITKAVKEFFRGIFGSK